MNFYNLDIKTIIVMLCIGNLVVVILFFTSLKNNFNSSIKYLVISKLLQAAAWLLLALRGEIPIFLSLAVGNFILFVGFSLESMAVVSFKKTLSKKVYAFYLVSPLIFTTAFVLFSKSNPNLIVVFISLFALFYTAFPGIVLLSEKKSSSLQKTLGLLYILSGLSLAWRGVLALISKSEFTLFTQNYPQALTFLSAYLLVLLGSIGFLLLIKEKMDIDLYNAATFDSLTGLYNRSTFRNEADKAISFASRRKEPVSLLMLDLDNFKSINDRFGHAIGDMVLKDFSATTKQLLRSYDVFGRYGGEEFVILLPNTSQDHATFVAERIRTAIEKRTFSELEGLKYTISIGVSSLIPEAEAIIDTLINSSDQALYTAKESGRNRVMIDKLLDQPPEVKTAISSASC